MIRTRSTIATLATLALFLATSAQALAQAEPEPTGLTGIEWTLTSITADGSAIAVPDGVAATLHLEAGEATGSGGCNSFFGPYKVDDTILGFGPIGATKIFCEGPEQDVEDAYLAALGSAAYWAISDDGSLRLLDAAESELLSFDAAAAGIEGITWLLREQAVGDTQAAVPEGLIVSLRMEDGQADGNGGCNRYFAEYRLGDSTIAFGGIGSTLVACQEPAGTVESTYLGNLAQVTRWTSDGATLIFTDDDGNSLLSYDAAPEASVVGSWIAQGINNGSGGVVSNQMTTNVTAQFSEDGDLTGFDGCNEYFTTYQVDGDAIAISDAIGSTKRACKMVEGSTPPMEYYAALLAATTWSVGDGGDLQLRNDEGSLQVNYNPAEG